MAAHTAPATRVLDLNKRTVMPGLIDGHAHMDREALRNVFPALGKVRSIKDIQDRIAELARGKKPGEWVVTMPIGDPPYYFDMPEILAEKRWPTRQELDAAAPNNPVFIRSIWGYWRGTFPLVSCANTEALKRAGITRDTVSPVPSLTIQKDGNGDPTGVFIEQEMAPIAEMIWFRDAARFSHADRLRALPQSAKLYHGVGTTSTFEGHGAANELLRVYQAGPPRRHADHALDAWRSARTGRRQAARRSGRSSRPGRDGSASRGLATTGSRWAGSMCRSGAARPTKCAPSAGPYTGWAGFNSSHGLPPDRFKELLLQCATNDIRAVAIAGGGGLGVLDFYEEVDKQIPLKGRRWVVSHVNVISPRDIERIARMGLVLTTHTNAYLYKALETHREQAQAGAIRRHRADECACARPA